MEKITIFTRGSSTKDLGPAAVGAQILNSKGKVLKEVSEAIGNATNDYAEYFAVVRALQVAKEHFGKKTKSIKFELKLDSELVKKQLNGECQIKEISLIGHFIEIHNLRVSSFFNLKFILIRRELNKEADRLAKKALDA